MRVRVQGAGRGLQGRGAAGPRDCSLPQPPRTPGPCAFPAPPTSPAGSRPPAAPCRGAQPCPGQGSVGSPAPATAGPGNGSGCRPPGWGAGSPREGGGARPRGTAGVGECAVLVASRCFCFPFLCSWKAGVTAGWGGPSLGSLVLTGANWKPRKLFWRRVQSVAGARQQVGPPATRTPPSPPVTGRPRRWVLICAGGSAGGRVALPGGSLFLREGRGQRPGEPGWGRGSPLQASSGVDTAPTRCPGGDSSPGPADGAGESPGMGCVGTGDWCGAAPLAPPSPSPSPRPPKGREEPLGGAICIPPPCPSPPGFPWGPRGCAGGTGGHFSMHSSHGTLSPGLLRAGTAAGGTEPLGAGGPAAGGAQGSQGTRSQPRGSATPLPPTQPVPQGKPNPAPRCWWQLWDVGTAARGHDPGPSQALWDGGSFRGARAPSGDGGPGPPGVPSQGVAGGLPRLQGGGRGLGQGLALFTLGWDCSFPAGAAGGRGHVPGHPRCQDLAAAVTYCKYSVCHLLLWDPRRGRGGEREAGVRTETFLYTTNFLYIFNFAAT